MIDFALKTKFYSVYKFQIGFHSILSAYSLFMKFSIDSLFLPLQPGPWSSAVVGADLLFI